MCQNHVSLFLDQTVVDLYFEDNRKQPDLTMFKYKGRISEVWANACLIYSKQYNWGLKSQSMA